MISPGGKGIGVVLIRCGKHRGMQDVFSDDVDGREVAQ